MRVHVGQMPMSMKAEMQDGQGDRGPRHPIRARLLSHGRNLFRPFN